MKPPPLSLSFFIWGLAALFYLFGFFQRVTPGVLTNELMRDFSLTAAALGNLSAFYFYFYAALQIPVGLLVDRIGPRILLMTGSFMAGGGAVLFGVAQSFGEAAIGRGLIGAAVSVGWVCILKLGAHWFPPAKFASVTGMSLAIGTMGAVLAGVPLRMLSDHFGWRSVMITSGALIASLAVWIWLVMRDDPADRGYASYSPRSSATKQPHLLESLMEVLKYKNTWLLFWVPSGVVGGFLTLTGLWGVPFLSTHYHLSTREASLITTAMLVVFSLGALVFGAWSDKARQRKLPFIVGAVMSMSAYGALSCINAIPLPILIALLLISAAGSGCMVIGFGFAKESVPAIMGGTVTGVVNLGVMLGPLVQQPLIGAILDYYWTGQTLHNVRYYDAFAFKAAFAMQFVWVMSSTVALLCTTETDAKQRFECN